ncbi:hypothetical protein JI750_10765 [Flavobacterium sp. GN10]|uniref:Uncharacterized protein n=1 Tax=Flavobacterium tagetis TaxID=2801336 RepID=A0ABS1KD06_9FLAO|nr:hypothetical protein [Flavobacterium tagetis]MBL0737371.1 hypothetical protein [Flavobacterium tagetis]
MLEILPLILILLPVLFQLIMGTKTVYKPISLTLSSVSWISIVSYILVSIISFYIVDYNFSKQYEQYPNPIRCGMPLLGIVMACFFLLFILVLVISIQFWIKRCKENRYKKQIVQTKKQH